MNWGSRNTGGTGKVNLWIFYLNPHGINNPPVHIHTKHKHIAVLHTVGETGWNAQSASVCWILTHLVLCVSLPAARTFVFRFHLSLCWNCPLLVLIHICGRCHSIFLSGAQGSPFILPFVAVVSKNLCFYFLLRQLRKEKRFSDEREQNYIFKTNVRIIKTWATRLKLIGLLEIRHYLLVFFV